MLPLPARVLLFVAALATAQICPVQCDTCGPNAPAYATCCCPYGYTCELNTGGKGRDFTRRARVRAAHARSNGPSPSPDPNPTHTDKCRRDGWSAWSVLPISIALTCFFACIRAACARHNFEPDAGDGTALLAAQHRPVVPAAPSNLAAAAARREGYVPVA